MHDGIIKPWRKIIRVYVYSCTCVIFITVACKTFLLDFYYISTESRRFSFQTWAPIDVLFCQEKNTRSFLKREAFSLRVSSSPIPSYLQNSTQIHQIGICESPHSAVSSSGLPHFSVEPQHMSVEANVSLSLSCVAHGPPEPVRVIWLQDGAPLNSLSDPVALSPSTFNLTGIFFLTPEHFLISAEYMDIKW